MSYTVTHATRSLIGVDVVLKPTSGPPASGTIVDVDEDGTLAVYVPELRRVLFGRPSRGITVQGDTPPNLQARGTPGMTQLRLTATLRSLAAHLWPRRPAPRPSVPDGSRVAETRVLVEESIVDERAWRAASAERIAFLAGLCSSELGADETAAVLRYVGPRLVNEVHEGDVSIAGRLLDLHPPADGNEAWWEWIDTVLTDQLADASAGRCTQVLLAVVASSEERAIRGRYGDPQDHLTWLSFLESAGYSRADLDRDVMSHSERLGTPSRPPTTPGGGT